MSTIDNMVTQVIAQLVTARNTPQATRPVYRRQSDLMAAVGITRAHTFNEIVTKAALETPRRVPGWALAVNHYEGYRLVDTATVRDLKRQLRNMRTARTIVARVVTVLSVGGNPPMVQMIAASLAGIVTQIEIAINALDKVVG